MTKAAKKPAAKKPAAKKPAKAQRADPALKRLPPALRERAQSLEDAARARLEATARAALDEARAAMEQAARGYYALGRALATLRKPGHAEAAGFGGGFKQLCETALGLSKATVDRLLAAVEHVTAAQYASLRPARVDALLGLAAATPADDTRQILAGEVVVLWEGGPSIDVAAASTLALLEAAAQVRDHVAATKGVRKRGKSASVEERALAKDATAALAATGSRATAKPRATAPSRPSVFDVVGLSADELRRVLAALSKGRKKPA